MTTYIIKSILCSGVLLMFYHLFLQKEKMHHFNRFYLLISIILSLVIPLISIELKQESMPISILNYDQTSGLLFEIPNNNIHTEPLTVRPDTRINWMEYVPMGFYILIVMFLLARLTRNLRAIYSKTYANEIILHQGTYLVLLPEQTVTFTFLNYIFISKGEYNQKLIEEEVLIHEMAHVRQKHSLDILFLEIVLAVFWFNPLLLLYKRAIRLNHEFLADEAVLSNHFNVSRYQLMLLDKILFTKQVNLTSSFNYSITKQRLAMMTRSTSTIVANSKKATVLILMTCMIYLISFKEIVAQKEITQPAKSNSTTRIEGVTDKQFDRYEAILKKMIETRVGRNGKKYTYYSMMDNDQVKIADVIFRSMSKEQQAKATKVPFIPMLEVPQITRPTQAQLDEWQNGKKFGVWLDERRISNAELKKYKPSDFDHYFVSKLEKNAINYGKHYFQIGLSTPKTFRAWQEKYTPLTAIPE
ncbi:M56 family metallopeptidase [Dyadobacter sp. CY312]|uniref:M56 family metallopeptidase n=1 Tax=Dyadobacter sp. CY312 TaxID=2907303 RepID=UPI001F43056A|nr:M56 family metallopeptidase [Dyadobacter sp. CY312]MCE7042391.1 M56 family metallopeptidase [Dyadobacter sp. CY312]